MVDGLSDSVDGSSESRWIPKDVLKLRDAWPVYGAGAGAVRTGREILSGFWVERDVVEELKCSSRVISRTFVATSLCVCNVALLVGGFNLYYIASNYVANCL